MTLRTKIEQLEKAKDNAYWERNQQAQMEITNILTPEGIKKLKKGQILMFVKDGKRNDIKITRMSKGRVWAKRVDTYDPEDLVVSSGNETETIEEHLERKNGKKSYKANKIYR